MLKAETSPLNPQPIAEPAPRPTGAGQSLEAGEADRPMPARLLAASQRVLDTKASAGGKGGFLRPYQLPAHDNFGHYLMDLATSPENETVSPFCRIVLPPRTGKTVIAASIIQLTGLCSVFVVPTKTLVTQTAREFASLLPAIPVGFFYGETRALVPNGINISTYAMLQRHFDDGRLPEWIRRAGLVFLDEAHHVMTPRRLTAIYEAFDEKALRIAITATPNYADKRRLHRYFPKLIHEIDLISALDGNFLAPTRMWLATVDVDASVVRIVAGDYEQETLGRLMSASPFFKAVELFRYSKSHIDIPRHHHLYLPAAGQ
jgi:superfamily II DNA or RNA helicase